MNDCTTPYGLSLGMPKKTNFRLTARKGTSRSKRKKLQGVVPQINLRSVKEEGYDVEPCTCGDDNYDMVHEREKDPEAASQIALKLYLSMTTHYLRIMVKDLLAFKLTLNCPWCLLACR